MDPKLATELAATLEEFERQLGQLKNLAELDHHLTSTNTALSEAAARLKDSAQHFPNSLQSLQRASTQLGEVAALLKEADPKAVAEAVDGVRAALTETQGALTEKMQVEIGALAEKVDQSTETAKRTLETTASKQSVENRAVILKCTAAIITTIVVATILQLFW